MADAVVVGTVGEQVESVARAVTSGAPELRVEPHFSLDESPPAAKVGIALCIDASSEQSLTDCRKRVENLTTPRLEHLVVVGSAAATGVHHHLPGLHTEEQARRVGEASALANRCFELEESVRRRTAGENACVLTILRVPFLLAPAVAEFPASLFSRGLVFRYAGYDPSLQFLGIEDLGAAIAAAIVAKRGGILNVAPRGTIPLRSALKLAGVRSVPAPRFLLRAFPFVVKSMTGAHGVEQMDLIRHPWTISGNRIESELGFKPKLSSLDVLRQNSGRPGHTDGDVRFDPFGVNEHYIRRHGKLWLDLLLRFYWRAEILGLDHVPPEGPAVIVGPHRGFMPLDGVMMVHLLRKKLGRIPRFLVHPTLVKFPFLGNFMRKLGGVFACHGNADYILARREILAVFPEGIQGAFKLFKNVYDLGRFGRRDYVDMALRHNVPIIPFAVVGNAEIFPILGKIRWNWFKKVVEWPFFPILASPVPLPSKWHIEFLPPLDIEPFRERFGADQRELISEIHREVKRRIQERIDWILERRPSAFFGNVFNDESH